MVAALLTVDKLLQAHSDRLRMGYFLDGHLEVLTMLIEVECELTIFECPVTSGLFTTVYYLPRNGAPRRSDDGRLAILKQAFRSLD